ncbi:MAG: hypothetical protein IJ125_03250 [Atopobiaceae bacterium]|nr:hypothetical protein [Atopobiaceae bacterium]
MSVVRNGKLVERLTPSTHAFVPFEKDGITYTANPNETREGRKARHTHAYARAR